MTPKHKALQKLKFHKEMATHRDRAQTARIKEKKNPVKHIKMIKHRMNKESNDFERYASGKSHSLSKHQIDDMKGEL